MIEDLDSIREYAKYSFDEAEKVRNKEKSKTKNKD